MTLASNDGPNSFCGLIPVTYDMEGDLRGLFMIFLLFPLFFPPFQDSGKHGNPSFCSEQKCIAFFFSRLWQMVRKFLISLLPERGKTIPLFPLFSPSGFLKNSDHRPPSFFLGLMPTGVCIAILPPFSPLPADTGT